MVCNSNLFDWHACLLQNTNNMVSGHYDHMASENASKNLLKEIDAQVSTAIAKNPNIILGDAMPICLVDAIEKFHPPEYFDWENV